MDIKREYIEIQRQSQSQNQSQSQSQSQNQNQSQRKKQPYHGLKTCTGGHILRIMEIYGYIEIYIDI